MINLSTKLELLQSEPSSSSLDISNKNCSENDDKHSVKQKLKSILLNNDYPELILNSEFDKFAKIKRRKYLLLNERTHFISFTTIH